MPLNHYLKSETIENMQRAFSDLIEFCEAMDARLADMGRALDPSEKTGRDIIKEAKGWVRVIEHCKRNATLDDLSLMAQQDGLYTDDSQ